MRRLVLRLCAAAGSAVRHANAASIAWTAATAVSHAHYSTRHSDDDGLDGKGMNTRSLRSLVARAPISMDFRWGHNGGEVWDNGLGSSLQ